jgi:hypothetical protein
VLFVLFVNDLHGKKHKITLERRYVEDVWLPWNQGVDLVIEYVPFGSFSLESLKV